MYVSPWLGQWTSKGSPNLTFCNDSRDATCVLKLVYTRKGPLLVACLKDFLDVGSPLTLSREIITDHDQANNEILFTESFDIDSIVCDV